MTEFSLFYVTCPNKEIAAKIGHELLRRKLIACTNILPAMSSQYWWEGQIHTAEEAVLILKGLSANKAAAEAILKKLHPSENPCFLQIEITDGSEQYLNWMRSI